MSSRLTKILAGAAAGVAATATMTVALALAHQVGALGELPPRKLTRRILGRFGVRGLGRNGINVAAAAAHVGYGAAAGALYALVPRRLQGIASGTLFGVAVWSASYQGWIPNAGLMPRPLFDRPLRPTAMVLAHVVFGGTLGLVAKALSPRATPAVAHRVSAVEPHARLTGTGERAGDEPKRSAPHADENVEPSDPAGVPVNPGDPGPPNLGTEVPLDDPRTPLPLGKPPMPGV